MAGIITVAGLTLPTTLPQREYDSQIRAGTIGIWDAKNPRSWPSQSAPTALSRTWVNLMRGGTDADVSTDFTWGVAGGFVRPSAAAARIDLGAPDLMARDVVLSLWFKLPSVPTAFTPLMGRSSSTGTGTDNQFMLSLDATGKLQALICTSTTLGTTVVAPSAITAGVHHAALHVRRNTAGGTVTGDLYLDGVYLASANAIAGTGLMASAWRIALGNRHATATNGSMAGVTYYRAGIEVPGTLTGAQTVAALYTAGVGRFS